MKKMNRLGLLPATIALCGLSFIGCASKPKTSAIPASAQSTSGDVVNETVDDHSVKDAGAALEGRMENISALNKAVGMPSIAMIRGFYQLPVANPLGAATFQQGNIAGLPTNQTIIQPSTNRPYAVEPADVFATDASQNVINMLLQNGIKLVELPMADATNIMNAEREAIEQEQGVQWNRMTPSGADYLISVQRGQGVPGPIYLARMIRTTDGAIVAVKSVVNIGGPYNFGQLLVDTIEAGLTTAEKQQSDAAAAQ